MESHLQQRSRRNSQKLVQIEYLDIMQGQREDARLQITITTSEDIRIKNGTVYVVEQQLYMNMSGYMIEKHVWTKLKMNKW